ncbi:MAG: prepilin-type N-terminal cleavage/methylation domain-containing protein [Patescibacteria group bacterium]|nr:prepilin-type N-terminal cleavage/methylation domain-containing protein [Patescibacteria group bacterium]
MKKNFLKKFISKKKNRQGFSLIELLIATTVVSLTLTAIATILIYSIKVNDRAIFREIATKKAQEGMDFFKRERVILGWNNFYSLLGSSYCLNQIPQPSVSSDDSAFDNLSISCVDYEILVTGASAEFKREVDISKSGGDTVSITMTVSWPKGDYDSLSVELTQDFKQY